MADSGAIGAQRRRGPDGEQGPPLARATAAHAPARLGIHTINTAALAGYTRPAHF